MVLIPKFSKTGQIVVVDLDTLDVEVVKFSLRGQKVEVEEEMGEAEGKEE